MLKFQNSFFPIPCKIKVTPYICCNLQFYFLLLYTSNLSSCLKALQRKIPIFSWYGNYSLLLPCKLIHNPRFWFMPKKVIPHFELELYQAC